MKTVTTIALLIICGFHNSAKAQSSNLPLTRGPLKSTITLISPPDTIIGSLYELKDSSILLSNSLTMKEYHKGEYEITELYIDNINSVRSKSRMGPAGGAAWGLLIGAGAGALMALITEGPPSDINTDPLAYAISVPFGAVVGATTGAIIGSIRIKIPINGSMENYNRQKKKLGKYTVQYPGAPTY